MNTNEQSSFENENIKVKLERRPGCRASLEVSVSPNATKASFQRAIADIRKEVSIPGFRKGKAPEAMILKNYEKNIESEWKDILLNHSFDEAVRLIKIFPFGKNSVLSASVKSASLENGSVLSFEYETVPTIPEINPQDLKVPSVPLKTVTEKDIQNTVEDLCLQSGEWQDVVDRPVEEGDFVVIDIDEIEEPGRNVATESIFQAKKGKMPEWMLRLVLNLSLGEIAEGMSEKEDHDPECKGCDDISHGEDNFKPAKVRIMLHTIRTVVPHVVDDTLSKKYGANNPEELKERIKLSLEKRAVDEQKDMQRQLMEHAIFQHCPFDLPASIIQQEVQIAKKSFIDDLRSSGQPQSKIAQEASVFEAQVKEKYERDFRLHFLTQKISQEHGLKVENNEITEELMRQMMLNQMGRSNINLSMDPKVVRDEIQMRLIAAKALDFLVEKSTAV